MNKKEFTDREEQRAVHAMRTLYARLIAPHGGLEGEATFPTCADSQKHVHNDTGAIYVAGDRKVIRLVGDTVEDVVSLNQKYYGLHSFSVDGVSYLAAGTRNGIDIVNLTPGVNEKKHIVVQGSSGSAFKNICTVGSTIDDMVLFASHSGVGVIRVPLVELTEGAVHISLEESKYIPLKLDENERCGDGKQVQLCASESRIVASYGSSVFELNNKSNLYRELFRLESKSISALSVSSAGIYVGTNNGLIYHDHSCVHHGDITSSITSISAAKTGVIFFTFNTNLLDGPLYQLGNTPKGMRLSSPTVQAQQVGVRGNDIFVLDGSEIRQYVSCGDVREVKSFETGLKRTRGFCVEK